MITRRLLLIVIGVLAFVLSLGRRRTLAMLLAGPERVEQPRRPPNRFLRDGRALVAAAGGEDVEAMVRSAIGILGGLDPLKIQGKTVLVKPNVVSGKPPPTTTNPAVVGALVRLLYQAGAKHVVVGDMSALITLATSSTLEHMEKTGLRRAAEEAGAEVVGFENHDWIEVPLPGARYVDKVLVTEWLYRVDEVINVPVIKTHRSASYSICLKNFIGCTHVRQRPYLVDSEHWEELVAEFNLAFQPALHVVDGTRTMIADGPWEGPSADTGLVLASGDPVAADAVGLGVIRHHGRWGPVTGKGVWEQKQIRRALELGLGRPKEEIRLVAGSGDEHIAELLEGVSRQTGLAREG